MIRQFCRAILFSLIIFSTGAVAQKSCSGQLGGKPTTKATPRESYTMREVQEFVIKNRILRSDILEKLTQEVLLFRLNNEDMGNSLFIGVLDKLGPNPSRQKDLMIAEFLSPLFDHYLDQFAQFTNRQAPATITRVQNFYGLSEYGFKPDSYNAFFWNKSMSEQMISTMKPLFSQKVGINLAQVNRMLVQIGYLHSMLTHQNKMSLAELKIASNEFELSIGAGHSFIPTIGEWDISNINAQWYMTSTVNMLPATLDQKIDVHGGLSSIEGLTHDHGHFFSLRLKTLADVLELPPSLKRPYEIRRALALDNKINFLVRKSLQLHHRLQTPKINPNILTNTIFFFIHQPEPMQIFLTALKAGNTDWKANSESVISLAHEMRLQLEKHTEFYPNLGKEYDQFEVTARYWLQLIGSTVQTMPPFFE